VSDLLANAAIQQINLGYDAEQDRLLLKVGLSDDTEISVWLTRRVVKTLWSLLQQAGISTLAMTGHFTSPSLAPELAEKSEGSTSSSAKIETAPMNYTEAYQPRSIARLAQPLLAKDCHLVVIPDQPSSLELTARDGATIKIALSAELTQAMGHMLQLATREAAWDISFTTNRIMMSETSARPVLH